MDGKPRSRKQFLEDITAHPKVVAYLPVSIGPSSEDIAVTILQEHISPCRVSLSFLTTSRVADLVRLTSFRILRLATPPCLVPKHSWLDYEVAALTDKLNVTTWTPAVDFKSNLGSVQKPLVASIDTIETLQTEEQTSCAYVD